MRGSLVEINWKCMQNRAKEAKLIIKPLSLGKNETCLDRNNNVSAGKENESSIKNLSGKRRTAAGERAIEKEKEARARTGGRNGEQRSGLDTGAVGSLSLSLSQL